MKASCALRARPDNSAQPMAAVPSNRRFSPVSTARWRQRSNMAEYKTPPSPSPTRSIDSAAAKKPALLIVDDDPLITDTLDFVLGRDFTVYVAESRAQVKSLLQQLEQPPELALI